MVNRKPNLIIITSDQQRGDCYGFAGRAVKTPHLDIMARQGTHFRNCITSSVVCQPSRAGILTGLLPQTHGVWDNGVDLEESVADKGFAGTLGRSGYRTAFIGKAHFTTMHAFEPTGAPECARSTDLYDKDWNGPYMGFQHVELVVMGHNRNPPMRPPFGQHYDRWFYADGLGDWKWERYNTRTGPDANAAQTLQSGLPQAFHNSEWTANQAIEYLRDRRDDDDPFALWISFPDPHHPFDAPEPWSRLHHPDEVDLPHHRVRDLDRRPWWHKACLEGTPQLKDPKMFAHRARNSRVPDQTDEQLRHIIANYYGMISLIDHNVGRIRNALRDYGLDDNTYVFYTSDHGDWLGDHGLLLKGPMLYEGLLTVGGLLVGPGVPAGHVVEDPVSTIDIPATLLDLAQAAPDANLHGKSLRPLWDSSTASRDFALNEWRLHPTRTGVALDLKCVRARHAKLTIDALSGAGEMYDLKEDPDEMHNIFDDPGKIALRRELEAMLATRPDDRTSFREPVGMA
ncbi:MAG: sulfatase-like hydrolase/transferase [Rhodospirillales bacterium]